MTNEKYYIKLYIFLLFLISLLSYIFINYHFSNNIAYADTTIPVYLKIINEYTGEEIITYVGETAYEDEGEYYYYGSNSDKTSGISYYLEQNSVNNFQIYGMQDNKIPMVYIGGAFRTQKSSGIPKKVEIFTTYFTITYELDNGINASNNPKYYYKGKSYSLYEPSREGYVFAGWYTNSSFSNKIRSISSTMAENLTLYAKWNELIPIPVYMSYILNNEPTINYLGNTFYCSNGTLYDYGSKTANETNYGMAEYLTQVGVNYYTIYNENEIILNQSTSGGKIFTEVSKGEPKKIVITPTTFIITYYLDGGINDSNNPSSYTSTSDTITLKNPTKEGYTFVAWYLDNNFTKKINNIKCESNSYYTLYALWSENITIPIGVLSTKNYENTYEYISVAQCYYYSPTNQFVFGKNDVSNSFKSIYDTYKDSYDIYLILEDQSKIMLGIINGYFLSNKTEEKQILKLSIEPNTFQITYNLYGGINHHNNVNTYTKNTSNINLQDPTKNDYVFIGWYLDEDFDNPIYSISGNDRTNFELYACWGEIKKLNVYIITTDNYILNKTIIDSINYYQIKPLDLYKYLFDIDAYLENFECANLNILDINNKNIPINNLMDNVLTSVEDGEPNSICLFNNYYSIDYELNGGNFDVDSINYYTSKSDLEKVTYPKKEGYTFLNWYYDSNFNESFSPTIFNKGNMTLYAKWAKNSTIPLYYYDSSIDNPEYVYLDDIEYFEYNTFLYCFATIDDNAKLKKYIKKYNTTSFSVTTQDNKEAYVTSFNSMYFSTIEDGIPAAIYIFSHYFLRFYVNGHYVGQTFGNKDDKIEFINTIQGFIGKNYDAIEVGDLTIGKNYAVYILKGWSLIDSSDESWFNKAEIELLEEDNTYSFTGKQVTNVYAYMTFYGKTNSKDSNIDYDDFIEKSHGIVTINSPYSLDDLTKIHVTEIDSDENKPTLFDKVLDKININKNDPIIHIIRKFINGEKVEFEDIWNSFIGKLIIFLTSFISIILFIKTFLVLGKLISELQNKT